MKILIQFLMLSSLCMAADNITLTQKYASNKSVINSLYVPPTFTKEENEADRKFIDEGNPTLDFSTFDLSGINTSQLKELNDTVIRYHPVRYKKLMIVNLRRMSGWWSKNYEMTPEQIKKSEEIIKDCIERGTKYMSEQYSENVKANINAIRLKYQERAIIAAGNKPPKDYATKQLESLSVIFNAYVDSPAFSANVLREIENTLTSEQVQIGQARCTHMSNKDPWVVYADSVISRYELTAEQETTIRSIQREVIELRDKELEAGRSVSALFNTYTKRMLSVPRNDQLKLGTRTASNPS